MKKSRRVKSVVAMGVGLFALRSVMFGWTLTVALNSYRCTDGSCWAWDESAGISVQKDHGK